MSAKYIHKKPKRDILTRQEIDNLIEMARCDRDKNMIIFADLTGARASDINVFKRESMAYDNDTEKVAFRLLTLKSKSTRGLILKRVIKIDCDAPNMTTLLKYAGEMPPEQRLFPISRQYMDKIIKRLDPTAHMHLFRATRATKLSMAGASTHQLKAWFGWTSNNTPDSYVRQSGQLIENLSGKVY